jgi:FAD/FMN-containing dehydrogenase
VDLGDTNPTLPNPGPILSSPENVNAELDIAKLRSAVDGPVLTPQDPGYAHECRTFNLASPLTPAVVVGAASPEDVSAAVRFAAANDLPVAVRGGGHMQPYTADGAVLVTLDRMNKVEINPEAPSVRVTGAARWQDVLDAAAPHGLAALNGSAPTVSAIGYALGGGQSPTLGRLHGYAADHITRLQVVTGDGEIRDVDASSELFTTLRGSKGALGVVTAMEIGLFDLPRILAGGLFFPGERLAEVLPIWRDWAATLPDEAATSVAVLRLPPLEFLPEAMRGAFLVHVRFAYAGPENDGRALLKPMRAAGDTVLDTVAEVPYAAAATIHFDPPEPLPYWDASLGLRELTDDTLAAIVDVAGPASGSPLVTLEIRALGGALDRAPAVADVVPSRGLPFQAFALGAGGPEDAPFIHEHLSRTVEALRPWAHERRMPNFVSPEEALDPELVSGVYSGSALSVIRAAKQAYDPANVFRFGLNPA